MNLLEKIVNLSKRRGFILPGSEIYGGMANSWDYGPLGAELKKNIKDEWWRRFVRNRADVLGLDAAIIMNPKVWEASGHVAGFSDPLVECKKCHHRFRADLPAEASAKAGHDESKVCPECGGQLAEAKQFNLMFRTHVGPTSAEAMAGKPTEEKENVAYLRPETAQGMFVDFKGILDTYRPRLPFGVAQIGKAFRNEITPGNFIFRTREFEQMEIEYFVRAEEWEKHFEMWLKEMKKWLKDLGVKDKNLEFVEIPEKDRAHYSKRTVDVEYKYPFGQGELYGLAYRGDFDLQAHAKASGQDLSYTDPENPKDKLIPHVIEPTWGVDRSILVAMLEAYTEEDVKTADGGKEQRIVMQFPTWLAPVKVAILPLSKKPNLSKVAKKILKDLSERFICEYDETQSIGKRYRRQDEIGTPYCVTVDFDTLKDKAVTVRDRDTMKQKRVKIAKLAEYLGELLNK